MKVGLKSNQQYLTEGHGGDKADIDKENHVEQEQVVKIGAMCL